MFWAPCSSGGGGVGGAPHTHAHACTCMHTHACTCTRGKHDNFMQMATPNGGIPGIPYDVIHVCMCVHVHMCGRHPLTTPHPHPPTHLPPREGDPWNQSKFNSTWTNQDISILFEDLKSVETSPPMDGCMIWGWVGWWVGSSQNTKNLKIVDWIKII